MKMTIHKKLINNYLAKAWTGSLDSDFFSPTLTQLHQDVSFVPLWEMYAKNSLEFFFLKRNWWICSSFEAEKQNVLTWTELDVEGSQSGGAFNVNIIIWLQAAVVICIHCYKSDLVIRSTAITFTTSKTHTSWTA